MNVQDKVVLVTGASKGIGAAITTDLAAQGAVVLLNYNSDDRAAEQVRAEVESAGGTIELLKADVTNDQAVVDMFGRIKEKYGKLDIVVGNAGGLSEKDSINDVDVFKSTFELNLFSQVRIVRETLQLMDKGKIIFVSSIHGDIGRGAGRVASYSASKAALNSYMKNLAKELAPNITVNVVAPGRTLTPAWGDIDAATRKEKGEGHAIGRMLQPEEIASGVRFLIENDSMSAAILTIDGGMSVTTLHS